MRKYFQIHRLNRSAAILFLSSVCIFGYLSLAAPIIATIVAGLNLHLLFAAPLLAAGLSAFVFHFVPLGKSETLLEWLHGLAMAMIPVSLFLLRQIQSRIDDLALSNLQSTSGKGIEAFLRQSVDACEISILVALCLPFFFYAPLVIRILAQSAIKARAQLYAVELLGILFGYVLSILVLDGVGMNFALAFVFLVASISLSWFRGFVSRLLLGGFLFTIAIAVFKPGVFLPARDINWSSRDFSKSNHATLISESWNTYSKVQTIKYIEPNGNLRYTISIGDGTGQTRLPLRSSISKVPLPSFPAELASFFQPKRALILFAGGGRDMHALAKRSPSSKIIGVELNPLVMEHALKESACAMKPFLKENADRVEYVNSEGRAYLESSEEPFDLILFSWSGATFAHLSGAIMHTTQYLFTAESIDKTLSRLEKSGVLIIFGASKINLLLSIMQARDEFSQGDFSRQTALLAPRVSSDDIWKSGWDEMVLLVKKESFTTEDLRALDSYVNQFDYRLVIGNHRPAAAGFEPIEAMIKIGNYLPAKNYINGVSNRYFSSLGDDRPFVYNVDRPESIYSLAFWSQTIGQFKWDSWLNSRRQFLFFTILMIIVVFSFATGVWFKRGTNLKSGIILLILSSVTGFLSVSFSLLATYKALLLLGNPSYSLIFAQVSVLTLGAFGAFFVRNRFVSIPWIATAQLVIIVSCLFFTSLIPFYESIGLTFFWANGVQLALIIIPTFFVSHLYSRVLGHIDESPTIVNPFNLIYAVNCMAGGCAAIFIPLAVENHGIQNATQFTLFILIFTLLMSSVFLHHLPSRRS